MMATSSRQSFVTTLRNIRQRSRSQWQPLEQQIQALRIGDAPVKRLRCLSTESHTSPATSLLRLKAAAEIEFKEGKQHTAPESARPVPVSASYFTRYPIFNDNFLELEKLARTYGNLPTIPPSQAERVAWKSLNDCRLGLGEQVKSTDYSRCLSLVKRLHMIHPELKPVPVKQALEFFKKDIQPYQNVPKIIPIDKHGRSRGVGRRKASVAKAFVVEGTGEVQVNGKSLADFFGRVHDRESAVWALHATNRLDKYNVWSIVKGGGTTGQAEALTLAVAKALLVHEPALKPALRRGKRFFVLADAADPGENLLTDIPSRLCYTRSEKSGEEEAWPPQGQEVTHLGKEIVQARSSIERPDPRMNWRS